MAVILLAVSWWDEGNIASSCLSLKKRSVLSMLLLLQSISYPDHRQATLLVVARHGTSEVRTLAWRSGRFPSVAFRLLATEKASGWHRRSPSSGGDVFALSRKLLMKLGISRGVIFTFLSLLSSRVCMGAGGSRLF